MAVCLVDVMVYEMVGRMVEKLASYRVEKLADAMAVLWAVQKVDQWEKMKVVLKVVWLVDCWVLRKEF